MATFAAASMAAMQITCDQWKQDATEPILLDQWDQDTTEPIVADHGFPPFQGKVLQVVFARGVEGDYLAFNEDLGQFGEGDSLEAAMSDLMTTIDEYAKLLWEQREMLSPHLQQRLAFVQESLGL